MADMKLDVGKRGRTGLHQRGRFGARNNNWKGGRSINAYGYVLLRMQHPGADKHGCVAEHRLVMMTALGRLLGSDEVVHHKNGNKQDNRLENLELTTRREHPSRHSHGRLPASLVCAGCGVTYKPKVISRYRRTYCGQYCSRKFSKGPARG